MHSLILYKYRSLLHLALSHFIVLFSLVWCCCVRPLMFIPTSTSLLFSLLTYSMSNPTASGLFSCRGDISYAVISGTSSFSKLNLFLVSVNLSSCSLCSVFLCVFLMFSCGRLVRELFLLRSCFGYDSIIYLFYFCSDSLFVHVWLLLSCFLLKLIRMFFFFCILEYFFFVGIMYFFHHFLLLLQSFKGSQALCIEVYNQPCSLLCFLQYLYFIGNFQHFITLVW